MRGSARDDIRQLIFKPGSTINKFIAINVAVFLVIGIIELVETVSKSSSTVSNQLIDWLAVPWVLDILKTRPWTVLTYMFVHEDIFHIAFNMLWLYWMGQIFEEYLGWRKFTFVYIAGGLAGAVFFIVLSNLVPAFHIMGSTIGASASVMALITATATLLPNYSIGLMFFGSIKLRWLAIGYVVLDLILIPKGNVGGQLAHLGGALMGFLYIYFLQRGNDWSAPFVSLFTRKKKSKLKVAYRSNTPVQTRDKTNEQIVDEILDKISKFGYSSLTEKEKQQLFKASQDID
jgi:membrane associated rhomboid family serine protease